MKVEVVDPRDGRWEVDDPTFRVYLWDTDARCSYEYEITGAEVETVIEWVGKTITPGWRYTIYVVIDVDERGGVGLVRIGGLSGDPFA
ncbi:hypothetical protein GV794_25955 [Nocardia cyriacigeorgica]|uniref:Uncharacterized protein n=1 Tax=Nocardia cyriacigeorgica TaxID=135487 RepID=A0ABX0CSB3_9NOCA|nr:hypothetical protein [Nocardia cyriacigeorgica]NEW42426.1 hypothetical protein [Nocardia cyriacigeorgica]NEW52607.1 hypothetical protein [Nocardia cyriacigeorgica]NEW59056.1 hypothetical protein [Nocardia cyriacigeorgica]